MTVEILEPVSATPDRSKRLEECEEIIDRGLLTFMEVGTALKTIQEEKLWVGPYGSFDDYLQKRWGFKSTHANNLIRAVDRSLELAQYARTIDGSGHPLLPVNAEQLKGLGAFKTNELRWQAWEKAVELAGGEQPSQDQVRTAVSIVRAELEPQAPELSRPSKKADRGSIRIGLPLENAARAMRAFYSYTELRCLALLITMREKG